MSEELTTSKVVNLYTAWGLIPADHLGVHRIDEHWEVAINRSAAEVEAGKTTKRMAGILGPWEIGFWFHGWFAGSLRPYMEDGVMAEQGCLADGSGANENTLRDALDRAINRATES